MTDHELPDEVFADLADIAHGDPAKMTALRDALRQLAQSQDALTREMARSVLDGHVKIRAAAMSSAYRPVFTRAATALQNQLG